MSSCSDWESGAIAFRIPAECETQGIARSNAKHHVRHHPRGQGRRPGPYCHSELYGTHVSGEHEPESACAITGATGTGEIFGLSFHKDCLVGWPLESRVDRRIALRTLWTGV